VSSLESAVSILRCFRSDSPELAVSDVARRLSMPKSTVSRLLRAMGEQGLVEQDAESRRYRVGLLPFRLGQLYQAHTKVIDLVDAEVETLVNETGFTAYIGVLNAADIVILRKRHGHYPVRMVLEPGYRMAAAATAFGKALLARLPDEELRRLQPPGPGAHKPIGKLLAELDAVRGQGWAMADEAFPGMCAIGAAVGSADDQPAVGFSLSFPDNAVNPKLRRTIAEGVVAVARRVALKTGDRRD
jgi:DNA-binding IclR family transcriptional regulator